MATKVTLLASGVRNGVVDGFLKSGNYHKGDVLEFVTDATDIASVADSASSSTLFADCTGVAIGDSVIGVAFLGAAADPVHDPGLVISGRVVDTDSILVDIQNDSGGALDPGSQQIRILVMKAA